MARAGGWKGPAVGLALLVALCAGCGSDSTDTVAAGRFEDRLVERYAITADQARCARAEIYRELTSDEIRAVYRSELADLPPSRWTTYLQAMVGCVLGEGSS